MGFKFEHLRVFLGLVPNFNKKYPLRALQSQMGKVLWPVLLFQKLSMYTTLKFFQLAPSYSDRSSLREYIILKRLNDSDLELIGRPHFKPSVSTKYCSQKELKSFGLG